MTCAGPSIDVPLTYASCLRRHRMEAAADGLPYARVWHPTPSGPGGERLLRWLPAALPEQPHARPASRRGPHRGVPRYEPEASPVATTHSASPTLPRAGAWCADSLEKESASKSTEVDAAIAEEQKRAADQARRELASRLMGQRMLAGWTMLAESCDACFYPYFSLRGGPRECVYCSVDIDEAVVMTGGAAQPTGAG